MRAHKRLQYVLKLQQSMFDDKFYTNVFANFWPGTNKTVYWPAFWADESKSPLQIFTLSLSLSLSLSLCSLVSRQDPPRVPRSLKPRVNQTARSSPKTPTISATASTSHASWR